MTTITFLDRVIVLRIFTFCDCLKSSPFFERANEREPEILNAFLSFVTSSFFWCFPLPFVSMKLLFCFVFLCLSGVQWPECCGRLAAHLLRERSYPQNDIKWPVRVCKWPNFYVCFLDGDLLHGEKCNVYYINNRRFKSWIRIRKRFRTVDVPPIWWYW